MKYIEPLSDLIIDTLKDFSLSGLKVTRESLCQALASREAILRLAIEGDPEAPPQISLCPPKGLFGNNPPLDLEENDAGMSRQILEEPLARIRSILLDILSELTTICKDEHLHRSSELQERLQNCQSMDALFDYGSDLLDIIRLLIGHTREEMEHTGRFLDELGKDLCGVENQILSYDDIHQQTYISNGVFQGKLLSEADQMEAALDSNQNSHHTIMTKLSAIKAAVAGKQKEDELRLREADRRLSLLQESIQNYKNEIAQANQKAEELEREAMLDSLTGIHNRRAYGLRIREEFRRFHRDGQVFSLALIDVDHFKQINDRYGHRTGDRCLKEIAARIKGGLRSSDFLARYGGEEFVAILAGTNRTDARTVAEKIRSVIERTHFRYRDTEIPVTISLGVTEVMSSDGGTEAIFVRADDAMYESKKSGRNRVTVG